MGWPRNAYIGQKVAGKRRGEVREYTPAARALVEKHKLQTPKFEAIYTIRGIFVHRGKVYLRFNELRNHHYLWTAQEGEIGFLATNFRPVEPPKRTTESGMSVLRGILEGQPVKEDA